MGCMYNKIFKDSFVSPADSVIIAIIIPFIIITLSTSLKERF